MGFSRETLAAIKDQADILQVIGSKVALTPSGANYKGLCPFHGEKTPSFMVNPARRMYHCFGCDAGGSVVDFVMAYERLDFPQAVRALAERFGIPLPEESGRRDATAGALRALQVAQAYHHDLLLNKPVGEPARAYLRKRALEESAWRSFGLGYASDAWRNLINHALGQGLPLQDLLAAGL
ncbi:MAG TPA: CHC2 zinc finger domain-containing protein, partial [bacterium]|nr:CHC2 zinc finger domain-containing protein [bacterium]